MTDEPGPWSWRNRWMRSSVLSVGALVVVSLLVGFVWLPSQQGDFTADGIWASICKAAGVPSAWGDRNGNTAPGVRTTAVVLSRSMARSDDDTTVGLGATIALRCTVCHGVRGQTDSDAPNLAGQYREVLVKQLDDYREGNRSNTVMQAFARNLSTDAIDEVSGYYAGLPRAVQPTSQRFAEAPPLVRQGDAMRNIAPCASCHGGLDHKLGAPWLDAMPKAYLTQQLDAFANGKRRNDSHGQMRNMARRLTAGEIDQLATYYARP